MSDTSEPAADQPDETPADTAPDSTDLAAELDKWKALARKHEERAKANAHATKELETLRAQSMTDQDKAIAAARAEATAETARLYGARLVDAEIRTAAVGRPVDVDALLEGLDRARFLDDDGEPDTAAVASWMNRVAPLPDGETAPARIDLGQGSRGVPASIPLNGDPIEAALRHELGIR